jgi:hypothetical protein
MNFVLILARIVLVVGSQIMTLQAFAGSAPACPPLAEEVRAKLDANTFMYIPINTYAGVYTQAKAHEFIEKNWPAFGWVNHAILTLCQSRNHSPLGRTFC